jgi:hypothetical protein
VDLTALLKLKQHGNDFAKYLTSFRERIAAITRSGKTAAQLWALMLNVADIYTWTEPRDVCKTAG